MKRLCSPEREAFFMAWIEFHQSLIRHPKTGRLARALGVSRYTVIGHLAALWCWGLDAKPDGGPLTVDDILLGADWDDSDHFVTAAVSAGFIESREDGFWIHDWDDYAGRLIRQRKLARDRTRTSRERNANVTHTVREQFASTQPNPTQPTEKTRKRVTEVDQEFKEKMYLRFPSKSHQRIDSEIETALGHKAALKYHDHQAYVRTWLTKSFEEFGSAAKPTPMRPPGMPAHREGAPVDDRDLPVRLA